MAPSVERGTRDIWRLVGCENDCAMVTRDCVARTALLTFLDLNPGLAALSLGWSAWRRMPALRACKKL